MPKAILDEFLHVTENGVNSTLKWRKYILIQVNLLYGLLSYAIMRRTYADKDHTGGCAL